MANHDPKQKLKNLLHELFQLNNTDLDFGIYRILHLVSSEVETFINTKLDEEIEKVKTQLFGHQTTDLKTELEEIKKKLSTNFQVNFSVEGDLEAKADQYGQLPLFKEPYEKLIELNSNLTDLHVSEETETSIYNDLYEFFSRYYEGGDFISMPRAGRNNYMIPYNGEEVKLYWANHDQYYIKTAENFKNYVFYNGTKELL